MGKYNVKPKVRWVWNRRGVQGEAPVELEISFRSKRKWITSGVRCARTEWDEKRARVVRRGDLVELNERLSILMNRVDKIIADLERNGKEFDFDLVDRDLVNRAAPGEDVEWTDWMEDMVRTNPGHPHTKYRKVFILNVIRRYNNQAKKGMEMRKFSQIRTETIRAWDMWLLEIGLRQNTRAEYHREVKRFFARLVKARMIEWNPYDEYQAVSRVKGDRIRYLNAADLERLRTADLSKANKTDRFTRDMFLVQAYTGMAYADVIRFSREKCEMRNGKLWYMDRRQKTGEVFCFVVLPIVQEIMERYNWRPKWKGYQAYLLKLKRLAEIVGLPVLTSHMARHTFAVMCLNNGVRIEVLAKMMGHADIKTTQIYAKILASSVEEEMDALAMRLGM